MKFRLSPQEAHRLAGNDFGSSRDRDGMISPKETDRIVPRYASETRHNLDPAQERRSGGIDKRDSADRRGQ